METLDANIEEHGAKTYFAFRDARQGIVHVIGPEQGATLPGMTVVCGDSHTSTHGAFAALAFGIGTSEVEHVLATQCLVTRRSRRRCSSASNGALPFGVTAKDIVLAIIGKIGTAGGTGYAIEFGGTAIRSLSMEGRMTVCNMTIEAGARAGMIGVDETTIAYLKGRRLAPTGPMWDRHGRATGARWSPIPARSSTAWSRSTLPIIAPQVTWGTSPEMVITIDGRVPDPDKEKDPILREGMERALIYMGLEPNTPMTDIKIDKVFIGSCTNSRIEDLRAAAAVVSGRRKADNVKLAMVVPGLRPGEGAGRARRPRPHLHRLRASNGASPAARCASP